MEVDTALTIQKRPALITHQDNYSEGSIGATFAAARADPCAAGEETSARTASVSNEMDIYSHFN